MPLRSRKALLPDNNLTINKAVIIQYKKTMYGRYIFTYNFSEAATRSSFIELIEDLGSLVAEDQPTYMLPCSNDLELDDVTNKIVTWSTPRDVQISKEDFVQLFYLVPVRTKETIVKKIGSK